MDELLVLGTRIPAGGAVPLPLTDLQWGRWKVLIQRYSVIIYDGHRKHAASAPLTDVLLLVDTLAPHGSGGAHGGESDSWSSNDSSSNERKNDDNNKNNDKENMISFLSHYL